MNLNRMAMGWILRCARETTLSVDSRYYERKYMNLNIRPSTAERASSFHFSCILAPGLISIELYGHRANNNVGMLLNLKKRSHKNTGDRFNEIYPIQTSITLAHGDYMEYGIEKGSISKIPLAVSPERDVDKHSLHMRLGNQTVEKYFH